MVKGLNQIHTSKSRKGQFRPKYIRLCNSLFYELRVFYDLSQAMWILIMVNVQFSRNFVTVVRQLCLHLAISLQAGSRLDSHCR
jgi:hypothetical protein